MSDQLKSEKTKGGQKKLVFVVFGPQGCGKSTQVARLAEAQKLRVFEAGEVLRQMSLGDEEIHKAVSQGKLISAVKMLEIVKSEIESKHDLVGYIFDGYPRDAGQFSDFETLARQNNWLVAGIFINLSDESAKTRLASRYSLVNGKRIVRQDDLPQVVQKRLRTFREVTLPLKAKFKEEFTLLAIDGEPTVDEVTAEINDAVDRFLGVA